MRYGSDTAIVYSRDPDTGTPANEQLVAFAQFSFLALLPFVREALFDLARRVETPVPDLPNAKIPDELVEALIKELQGAHSVAQEGRAG